MNAVEDECDGADGYVAGDDVGSISVARGETAEPGVESLSSGDGDLDEAARWKGGEKKAKRRVGS